MSMSVSNFGASVRSFLGGMTLKEAPEASLGGRFVTLVRNTPYVQKIDSLLSVQRFGNVIHGVERVVGFILRNEQVERASKMVRDQEERLRVLIERDEALDKMLKERKAYIDDMKNKRSSLDAMKKNMNDAHSVMDELHDELKKIITVLECLEKISQISDDIQNVPNEIQANSDQIAKTFREMGVEVDPIIANFEGSDKNIEGKEKQADASSSSSDPASSADPSSDKIPDPVVQSQEQSQEHDNHFTTENQTSALQP